MADLGRKHVCFKCSAKFYDMKKPAAICPRCGADQADAPVVATPPPPPPPRRPRAVDPVEEEPMLDDEGDAGAEDDLDLDGGDEEAGIEEALDEPQGEDSYD